MVSLPEPEPEVERRVEQALEHAEGAVQERARPVALELDVHQHVGVLRLGDLL